MKNRPQFAGNVTEAHKQLTNKSQSKQCHDFGKGENRFKIYDRQARTINQSIGYELPSTLKSKAISFGIGGRSVPELKNVFHGGPDPGAYKLPSDFDKSTIDKKGGKFSFGAPRNAYDRVYYKERIPHDRSIPGPGTY